MAAPRFLALLSGRIKQVVTIATSAGAGDADKIPATGAAGTLDPTLLNAATTGNNKLLMTDGSGKIDNSVLPSGVGASVVSVTASEALSAGNIVNIYNNAGTPNVRKADATAEGKEANGFVLASVSSSATATVYLDGAQITGLSGLTAGARQYVSITAGAVTATPPSTAGNVVQCVGVAVNATTIDFMPAEPVTLA